MLQRRVTFFEGNYWPKDDYLQATSADSSAMLRYLPWHLADLEYGQDATTWLRLRMVVGGGRQLE